MKNTYKCGWCGEPTFQDGEPLDELTVKAWTPEMWRTPNKTNGRCCTELAEKESEQLYKEYT